MSLLTATIGFQPDDAADIEDDGAIGFAHRVAKGAGAGIVERGDVDRCAAGAAGGKPAETFRARQKRWRNCPQKSLSN